MLSNKMTRLIHLFILFFLFFGKIQGNKGVIVLKKNLPFKQQVELEGEGNTVFEIRYDYDLDGERVAVPSHCTLRFVGGSVNNGILALADGDTIEGVAILTEVRVIALGTSEKHIKDIALYDITLDGNQKGMLYAMIHFEYVDGVCLNHIGLANYNRVHAPGKNNYRGEERYKYHCMYVEHCSDISVDELHSSGVVHPEGPAFYYCSNLKCDRMNISDKENNVRLYTCVNIFHSSDVVLSNSYFYHSTGRGGSTVNFSVDRGKMDRCILIGGLGIDIGNEGTPGETFMSDNVVIQNCTSTTAHLVYTAGLTDYEIDSLVVENCKGNITNIAFRIADNIGSFVVRNTEVSHTGNSGRALVRVDKHETAKDKKTSLRLEGVKYQTNSLQDCSMVMVADEASVSDIRITDSQYLKPRGGNASQNRLEICMYASASPVNLYLSNNILQARRFGSMNNFATAGRIIIENNHFMTYNDLNSSSIHLAFSRNTSNAIHPNSEIIVKDNIFDGMGILISNSTASPMTIANNTFGDNLTKRAISLAGTMERVKILSNTSKKGSNMQLYNNSASFGRDVKIIDNRLIKRGLSHDIDTTRRQINTH